MNLEKTYDKIIQAVLMPIEYVFPFLSSSQAYNEKRIYYVYFLASVVLGFIVYVSSHRKEGFIKYFFNPKVWMSKSALVDYAYIFFNSFVKVFLLSFLFKMDKYISFYFQDELISWFGYSSLEVNVVVFSFVFLLSLTVVEDFFSFLIHYLFHKVPFLWHFHKVHHSATVMNPITQYRIHPVELLFNNLTYLFALGILHGFFSWMFYKQAYEITATSRNVFMIVFFISGANLRHSHVRLSYFPWLEKVLISPFQHQIHHSDHPDHFNKNMGSKLAIWDWLFGTLVRSKEANKIKFGIGEENKDYDTFFKSLINPFLSLFIPKNNKRRKE